MGRADRARRERHSRSLTSGLRCSAGAAASSFLSFPRFLSRLPRAATRVAPAALLLAGSAGIAAPASADTLVSNLGQTAATAITVGAGSWAQGFETGSHSTGYDLSAIVLDLNVIVDPATTLAAEITIRLHAKAADSDQPGNSLHHIFSGDLVPGSSERQYSPPSRIVLAADTKYFLVMSSPVRGSDVHLGATASDLEDSSSTSDWSILDDAHSYSAGSWSALTSQRAIRLRVLGTAKAVPTASNSTVEMKEDATYTFTASDFNYSGSGTLDSVKIVSVETAGDLELDGTDVTAGQEIDEADIYDGNLTFKPVADANGAPYATFTFKVSADGSTFSDDTYTMTIDVDSVPDVTDVSVTSTPRSGTGTPKEYGAGEEIEVTVTFDEAVEVTGTPRFDIRLGNSGSVTTKNAGYKSGSGTTKLVFAYEVQSTDEDDNGIFIEANALKMPGNNLVRDFDGNRANVTHGRVGPLGNNHKVDGSLTPPSPCPTGQPADAFWTACLTAATLDQDVWGYQFESSTMSTGTLTPATFTLSGNSYEVRYLASTPTFISIGFKADTPTSTTSNWVLQVGGDTYNLSDATYYSSTYLYDWTTTESLWASNDKVSVSLRAADDTTAPEFESATVNGTSLVITFDEDLAAAANLANSAFTVKKTPSGGTEATVTLAGSPSISGKTVTLTLASAVVSTDTVTVAYTKPTTGSNNKLKDAADNEVATFAAQSVTNNTPAADTTTPTVSAALVSNLGQTSTDEFELAAANDLAQEFTTGGHSGGYTLTSIVLRLDAVAGTTPPTVKVFSGSADGTEVATLTGPASLTIDTQADYSFTAPSDTALSASTTYWVVAEGGSAEVGWAYTDTNNEDATPATGWSIGDAGQYRTASSTGSFSNLGGAPELLISVNGTEKDTTAPEFESAAVNGTSLVVTFDEDLAAAANLANSAFTVKKTPSSGTEATASLAGSPSISGKTVTLTLASAVVSTDTVTVAYTKPTTGSNNKLKDAADNEVATFAAQSVTNNTPAADTTTPTVSAALVSNLGQTSTDEFELAAANDLAQEFTTGGHSGGYTLTSIVLRLDAVAGTTPPTVKVFSGSADGTEVATLTGPASLTIDTQADYSFTAPSDTALSASTTYWVVAEGGSAEVGWAYTDTNNEDATPATGWSIGDAGQYRTASSTGSFSNLGGAPELLISVNGTAKTDTTAPTVSSAQVTAAKPRELVVTFSEALATDSVPDKGQFTVKVGGTAEPALRSSVVIDSSDATKLRLRLAVALDASQTSVTLDYTNPGTANNPLEDAAGNEVATFTGQAVTNNAPACPSGQPADAFWTACLTVGDGGHLRAGSEGYSSSAVPSLGFPRAFGGLSPDGFSLGGQQLPCHASHAFRSTWSRKMVPWVCRRPGVRVAVLGSSARQRLPCAERERRPRLVASLVLLVGSLPP